jgi:surfactin synthase thioesterase subunit
VIATSSNSWIGCSGLSRPACLRLFCFPYAGGGAAIFRAWADDLPQSIQVCPVQLPGRESRLQEPLFVRLEPLVAALSQAIRPYLSMPFAFWGHSLGALIGFELARTLAQQNAPGPIHLFVSGHSAPQIQSIGSSIHLLPDPEFIAELERLNGTPAEVLQNAELMELLLPVLRADFAVNETYTYSAGEPLDCPISAFGGLQDTLTSRDKLEAWRHQTRGAFTLRMFPGDHFFLHNTRAALLHALAQDAAQSLSRMSGSL